MVDGDKMTFTLSDQGYDQLCQAARLRGVDPGNPQHLEQFILYKCGVQGVRHPPVKKGTVVGI
jgi:hypothetical protein